MAENLQGTTCVPNKRCKRDALRAAFVADKDVVQENARWWESVLRPQVEAPSSSEVDGAEAAVSARMARECNRIPGQELPKEENTVHADLVRAAKEKDLEAWKSFWLIYHLDRMI